MVEANLSKTEEVYLHIIKSLQDTPTFGKTLFYKILYFSDFDYYERFGKSITGDEYRLIDHGPAPCNFDETITKLKNKNLIKEFHSPYGGMTQVRYHDEGIGLKTDKISQKELEELERNIKRLSGMTATQVSAYSHQDMPCKATKTGEIINYELVHYRNPMFSVALANLVV